MNTWKDIVNEIVGTPGTNEELAHAFCYAHAIFTFCNSF